MSRLDRETDTGVDVTSDPPPTILTKTLPAVIGDWTLRGAVKVSALTASEGRALTLRMFADGEPVFESSVPFTSGATAALRTKRISYSGVGVEAGAALTLTLASDNANDTTVDVDARLNADVEDIPHTWFVDATHGHDTEHDGRSALTPLATVGAAVTVAASGDTIQIGPGTFAEAVDLVTADKSLTLQGAGMYRTVITQSAAVHTILLHDDCTLLDLSVISTREASGSAINATEKTNPRLERVYVEGQETGGVFNFSGRMVIRDCFVKSELSALVLAGDYLFIEGTACYSGSHYSDFRSRALSIDADHGIVSDCIVVTERETEDLAQTIGLEVSGAVTFRRTSIYAANCGFNLDADVVGVRVFGADSRVLLDGCVIETPDSAGGDRFDILHEAGEVAVTGTWHDPAKTSGTITHVQPSAAILADTDALDARLTDARAARLDADVSSRATPADVTTAHATTDGKIDALNNLSAAQVKTQADGALADYDPPTKTEMDAAHALLATPADVHTTVTPVQINQPPPAEGTTIEVPENSDESLALVVLDSSGDAVDLTDYALTLEVYKGGTLYFDLTTAAGEITITGAEAGQITIDFAGADLAAPGRTYRYELWGTLSEKTTRLIAGTFVILDSKGPQ